MSSIVNCLKLSIRAAAFVMTLASTLAAAAETVEVAPGVQVTKRTYSAPTNEQPFFGFEVKNSEDKAADDKFVDAIVAATGNRMLMALHEVLNRARKDVVWGTLRKALLRPERREYYSSEHGRVVEAILNRDPLAAGAAMRGHIGTMVSVYSKVEDFQASGQGSITF